MSSEAVFRSARAVTGQSAACWLPCFKVVYLAGALVMAWVWKGFDTERFYAVNARWPREGEPIFASHFATWDAAHYLYLSEVGYDAGVPSCAFYPLWPLLVRGSAPLLGGSHIVTGLVLANVISLVAWVVFLRLVTEAWGAWVGKLSLLFLLAYPGALFFQFIYSESLFFLLVMLLWLGLERRRYGLAWAAAFLLPTTRAVGLFCVFPILWHLVAKEPPNWMVNLTRRFPWLGRMMLDGDRETRERREKATDNRIGLPEQQTEHESPPAPDTGRGLSDIGLLRAIRKAVHGFSLWPRQFPCRARSPGAPDGRPCGPSPPVLAVAQHSTFCIPHSAVDESLVTSAATSRPWWLLLAPLAGWGCYLALMWRWTGNPFEGFEAQKHWRVHSISNLWNVPKFVIGLFSPTEWHAFTGSLLDRCVFILLLYCLPLIWRLDKGLFVWAWVLGVMPAMSGTFTSFTRFASCAFPLFIALAVFLSKPERRWLRYVTFAVFGVLHVVLVWRFVNFRWAG